MVISRRLKNKLWYGGTDQIEWDTFHSRPIGIHSKAPNWMPNWMSTASSGIPGSIPHAIFPDFRVMCVCMLCRPSHTSYSEPELLFIDLKSRNGSILRPSPGSKCFSYPFPFQHIASFRNSSFSLWRFFECLSKNLQKSILIKFSAYVE